MKKEPILKYPAPDAYKKEESSVKKKRAIKVLDILVEQYPEAKCHLDFENPFQLLISTILAAQCTDIKVNRVMAPLYKKYKKPADFAKEPVEKLQELFKEITFFRMKSKSVKKCTTDLVEKFGGKVPENIKDLLSLAGVGRKTANVVLANCFGQPAITTDTHVIRVSGRLGFSDSESGDIVEKQVSEIIPKEKQTVYSHTIGEHGRQICKSQKPKCPECAVCKYCPSYDYFMKMIYNK